MNLDDQFDPDEVKAVRRYYDAMLKKHRRRLRVLDARGTGDEQRDDTLRSIRKYEIVLDALTRR